MCLFVMPIAIAGLKFLPQGANPDLYVLTLPLSLGREDLALLAFLDDGIESHRGSDFAVPVARTP